MNAWKTAKVGDYLRMKHLETGVWKTVKVTERFTKRGRNGFTRLTLRFANGNLHNLYSKDFGRFRTEKAIFSDKRKYDRGEPTRQAPPQEEPRERPNPFAGWTDNDWANFFNRGRRPAARPTPENPDNELFMKYAGMVPKTADEAKECRKKMAFALHPDRSGWDSTETFLKAMAACDRMCK